ncbi:MBL fold metallo-hydrolase [Brevibacillus choshinensis]|nr:MBL fold metallo-hydrolase [Brevibacillus choshinensis]
MNGYVIEGKDGMTLVDTGSYAEQSIDIWKRVLPVGTKVEKVLLTHSHTDHIGLAKWLRDTYRAPVLISRIGYEEMQKFHRRLQDGVELSRQYVGLQGLVLPVEHGFVLLKMGDDDTPKRIPLIHDGYEHSLSW